MIKKINVAVLMGGKSAEHEISLITGREVVKNLDPEKYRAFSIVISKDGKSFKFNYKNYPLGQLSNINCQIFFIAMHGSFGEDGRIQGFLDFLSVLYTGSGVLASALGMDKLYSRKLFIQAGLNIPDYIVITEKDNPKLVWEKLKKTPIFVHPHNQGSAVGSSLVNTKEELKKALILAHKYSKIALVDRFIKGVEITCAILGNEKPRALPLIEIIPKKTFFDYEAKYDPKLCEEIVPARISPKLTRRAQAAAITAYGILGCRGFGRVDMIIEGQKVYVLEVNTIPGLTPVSLFPKAASAAGISYPKLLDKIISYCTP